MAELHLHYQTKSNNQAKCLSDNELRQRLSSKTECRRKLFRITEPQALVEGMTVWQNVLRLYAMLNLLAALHMRVSTLLNEDSVDTRNFVDHTLDGCSTHLIVQPVLNLY